MMRRWITLVVLVACGGAEFSTGPGDGGAGGAQGDGAPLVEAGPIVASDALDMDAGDLVDAAHEAACTTATHGNGVGESYESCAAPGTYTPETAMAACEAYALAIGDNASNCFGPWNCGTSASVCHGSSTDAGTVGLACITYCWVYSGVDVGTVSGCDCPFNSKGHWQ
jgi:hypothetical protein